MRRRYKDIKALGAEVVTISSDSVEALRKYKAKTRTEFPMLSDERNTVAALYKIQNHWELIKRGVAHPSAFIIDRDGIVRFAEVRRNHLFRIRMATVISELKKLDAREPAHRAQASETSPARRA
jgi:peroxiredoxin